MIIPVSCSFCTSPHFDHYECDKCTYNFGFLLPKMNYCPNCGQSLVLYKKDYAELQKDELDKKLKEISKL